MDTPTATPITQEQVRDFLAALLTSVSPDSKTGMVMATYSGRDPAWKIESMFSLSFSGHGMALQDASTVDELVKVVAQNTPASKARRRKAELLKELEQVEATLQRETQP